MYVSLGVPSGLGDDGLGDDGVLLENPFKVDKPSSGVGFCSVSCVSSRFYARLQARQNAVRINMFIKQCTALKEKSLCR